MNTRSFQVLQPGEPMAVSYKASREEALASMERLNRQVNRSFVLTGWEYDGSAVTLRFGPCGAYITCVVQPTDPWWRRALNFLAGLLRRAG